MFSPIWDIFIITPPPKAKGSLSKRGIKTSKEPEMMDKHKETESFIYSTAHIH